MKKFFIAIACLLTWTLHAGESPFAIWLSSSVVTTDRVNDNNEFMAAAGPQKEKLRSAFLSSFKKAFPDALETIDRKKQKRTSAVFLNISRAAKYEVKAVDSNVILYSLPVTATITFMNVSTGEVLYSEVFTHIGNVQTITDDPDIQNKIITEYENTYKGLIDELAQKASSSFVPKKFEAKIVGKELGLLVLDKGLSDGIAEGDSLDGEFGLILKVKYSAMNYSIAREEFGTAKIGSVVSKTYNQTLADIKKPKVSLLDIDYNRSKLHVPPNMFYQFFVDKLAQKGSFTLLSVNKSAWKAINALQESANLGIRFPKRNAPEYFMRLWIEGPESYDLPTNVTYALNRNYHMTICGEILDTSARVLASSCKHEQIEDKVSFGKGYSKEAQYEVLAKNAALSLAEEFAKTISFEPISYVIQNVDGDMIEIRDEKNVLGVGSSVSVYRNVGDVGAIQNINIPISEITVQSKEGERVFAKEVMKIFNGAPDIKKGDMIFDQKPKNSQNDSKLFTLCEKSANLGGEEIFGFEKMANFMIPKSIQYPFYNSKNLQKDIDGRLSDAEFEKIPVVVAPSSLYCMQPAYKYFLISSKDSDQVGYLEKKYNTIIGVKEFFGEQEKSKYGVGGEKTFYPPVDNTDSFMKSNMLKHSMDNLEMVVKKLEIK